MRRRIVAAILLGCILLQPVRAEEPAAAVRLELTAAGPSQPMLKYRLTLRPIDQQPGNAALLYLGAALFAADRKVSDDFWDNVDKWLTMPPAELPKKEIAAGMGSFAPALELVKLAAHREDCHWDFAVRERGVFALLSGINQLRDLGRLLALSARVQLVEGRFEDAANTLAICLQFARHVNNGQILICSLVGVAMANEALNQVEEFAQTANSPNLYWPLSMLPRPLIDLRATLDAESDGMYTLWPRLKELRTGDHTAEDWDAAYQEIVKTLPMMTVIVGVDDARPSDWHDGVKPLAMVVAQKANARAWFLAQGMSAEEVDKMPQGKMVLQYTLAAYEQMRDDVVKWLYLPYPEARAGLLKAEAAIAADHKRGGLSIARMLLPAFGQAAKAPARLDRRVAALRCIEGLRLYAAAHNGQLPNKLTDIQEAPIPMDPMWNRPFDYKLQGETALLTASAHDEQPQPRDSLKYEISIRKEAAKPAKP